VAVNRSLLSGLSCQVLSGQSQELSKPLKHGQLGSAAIGRPYAIFVPLSLWLSDIFCMHTIIPLRLAE
jgi:hypothetical protein